MYLYAVYWSAATTTGVGYGDVSARPMNAPEH